MTTDRITVETLFVRGEARLISMYYIVYRQISREDAREGEARRSAPTTALSYPEVAPGTKKIGDLEVPCAVDRGDRLGVAAGRCCA